MKKCILPCLMFLTLLLCSNLSAKEFKFVSFEFPPLEYTGKDGNPTGIIVDVVINVMNELGHDVTIKIYPWARSLKMVKSGKADAIFTAYKNEERLVFLDYSKQVLAPQRVVFYKRKGAAIDFDGDLLKLKNNKIGVISTISYGNKFDSVRDQLNIDRGNKLVPNFRKLMVGRLDLIISNLYTAEIAIKENGFSNQVVRLSEEVQSVPSYIAFSKKMDLSWLRDQFDEVLERMKKNGEYVAFMEKYGVSF